MWPMPKFLRGAHKLQSKILFHFPGVFHSERNAP